MPSSASNSSSETSYLALRAASSIRSMRAAQISVILHPRAVQEIPGKGLLAASGRLGPVLVGMLDSICRTSPAATPARRSRTMLSTQVARLSSSSEDRLNGWYIGGGFDMSLTEHLKIGVEYRHYEFENDTVTPFNSGVAVPDDRWSLDTNVDSVTARLTYLFGSDRYEPVPLK